MVRSLGCQLAQTGVSLDVVSGEVVQSDDGYEFADDGVGLRSARSALPAFPLVDF